MRVGRCNAPDCGARILWVRTINHKWAPIDAEPVEFDVDNENVLVLVKRNEAEVPLALSASYLGNHDPDVRELVNEAGAVFYVDHHATCADPDSFRDTPL